MNTKQIFNPDAAAQRFASLSRRNFLRGLGACMALPALESVMPAGLLAANGKAANLARTATGAPLRMAYVYFPNGAIQPSWWPKNEGADFDLSRTLQPLAPVKHQLQVLGGITLGLIALFSSYDHITLAGRTLQLQQQWGIPFIAASLATVFVDAQLATRSRLRAARDAVRAAQDAARIADETAEDRDRADQERNRAVEARERQRKGFERLDQAALFSARVQLDPNPTNRARLQFFLTLMANRDGTEA